MGEFDNGVPSITDPWPVKSVRWIICALLTSKSNQTIDRVRLHHGARDDCSFPGMVPLHRGVRLLPCQGL